MLANPKTLSFRLNRTVSLEALTERIVLTGFKLEVVSSSTERREFYDTFEWQAFGKRLVIVKKQKALFLIDLNTGQQITSVPFSNNSSSFFFDALPRSTVREELSSCSNIRAFSRLCMLDTINCFYRILDDNKKTIATLTSESLSLAERENQEPFLILFSLSPLRGYEKEIAHVVQSLSTLEEVTTVLDFKEYFLLIMREAQRNVEGYSAKIMLTLNPDAPIHESARQLLQFTCSVMRLNEEGIKKDIDSEFLHDYRVAIRRTRSVMKQLKGVFDSSETTCFLNFFSELGKRTNELRDQDVYLLRKESYFNYLPPFLQPSLKLFFRNIDASRKPLHKQFCHYLSSSDYQSSLKEWEVFIKQEALPEVEQAPNASRPTKEVAVGSIKKSWKKVIRHGRHISRATTDEELHALRIDCKKLRYLLEFFSSIFPPETITPVIRQLKELQENLGDFVDFAVQLRFLHEQLATMAEEKLLAASMGGLMTTLFQKQEAARLKFHKTFSSFDHEETSQLFHDLLTDTQT
jgi:CHAD domain-containing protein